MTRGKAAQGARRRDRRLEVRLTEDEYEFIRMQAERSGRTVTDYVVWRCIHMDGAKALPPRGDMMRLYNELVAQGNNLNQIARACNRIATMDLGDTATRVKALRDLEAVRYDAIDARKSLDGCYETVASAFDAGLAGM